ncbi:hypothetical protein P3342_004023 [Pyrenophora teres f. teres]|nr:hypothetical protein P3342_004023 [Pyrenophora teres f. teres]
MPDQTKYTNKLTGSRVLIIGGSSGIGFTVAEACIEHGALVTISSSNPERFSKAVARLQESYPSAKDRIWGLKVDLGNQETLEEELKGLFEKTVETMGGESIQTIQRAGTVRFFAPLLLAKHIPTYLHARPTSSYILTTGVVAEKPMPNWSVIASYAGAAYSMVRGLALDLKPIRVNGVSPGAVDTEIWDGYGPEVKAKILESMGAKMATGKVGRPEDVAESYLGLLKDGNVDGVVVRSDGGSIVM